MAMCILTIRHEGHANRDFDRIPCGMQSNLLGFIGMVVPADGS
jgi:hypothetical protein